MQSTEANEVTVDNTTKEDSDIDQLDGDAESTAVQSDHATGSLSSQVVESETRDSGSPVRQEPLKRKSVEAHVGQKRTQREDPGLVAEHRPCDGRQCNMLPFSRD